MEDDWIKGLIGGLMIGTGGAVYLLGNGRIMGASGILGGLVDGSARSDRAERVVFLGAVMLAGLLLWPVLGGGQTHATGNLLLLIAAGLLVGIGTRMANGCTSGHGVCGMSRLSPRGIVASAAYVGAGGLCVAVFRHLLGVI